MEFVPGDIKAFKLSKKEYLFDRLVEEAIIMVKDGKLYGFEIDITNPRDIIAALFVAYQNKEYMVKEFPPRYTKSERKHNV